MLNNEVEELADAGWSLFNCLFVYLFVSSLSSQLSWQRQSDVMVWTNSKPILSCSSNFFEQSKTPSLSKDVTTYDEDKSKDKIYLYHLSSAKMFLDITPHQLIKSNYLSDDGWYSRNSYRCPRLRLLSSPISMFLIFSDLEFVIIYTPMRTLSRWKIFRNQNFSARPFMNSACKPSCWMRPLLFRIFSSKLPIRLLVLWWTKLCPF